MSYDLHGNPLREGHCENHPSIAEPYPCSMCVSESMKNFQRDKPSYPKQSSSSGWVVMDNENLFHPDKLLKYVYEGISHEWRLIDIACGHDIATFSDNEFQAIKEKLLRPEPINVIHEDDLKDALRDQFAIAAMQGLVASWGAHDVTEFHEIADDAYNLANAMLAIRGRKL